MGEPDANNNKINDTTADGFNLNSITSLADYEAAKARLSEARQSNPSIEAEEAIELTDEPEMAPEMEAEFEEPENEFENDVEIEEEVETAPAKAKRTRISPVNEVEARALQYRHDPKYRFTPLEDLLALAKQELNPTQADAEMEDGEPEPEPIKVHGWDTAHPDEITEEIERLQELSDELKDESIRLIAKFDDESADAKLAEAKEIREHIKALKKQIPIAQERFESIMGEREASAEKVITLYPDVEKKGTRFNQRFNEIHKALKLQNDPRLADTNLAEQLAEIVALELGVQPATEGKKAKDNSARHPLRQPVPASQHQQLLSTQPRRTASPAPAKGSESRSQNNTQPQSFSELADNINTLQDWIDWKAKSGLSSF